MHVKGARHHRPTEKPKLKPSEDTILHPPVKKLTTGNVNKDEKQLEIL